MSYLHSCCSTYTHILAVVCFVSYGIIGLFQVDAEEGVITVDEWIKFRCTPVYCRAGREGA